VNKKCFCVISNQAFETHSDKTATWMSSQLMSEFTIFFAKHTHNVHESILLHSSSIVEEDNTTETESIGRIHAG